MIKRYRSICAACGFCADTCFYYNKKGDPRSTPSYKALNSLCLLMSRDDSLSDEQIDFIRDLIWGKCVLCGQCSCPMGIDIPAMIAKARALCRQRGIYEDYSESPYGI